MFTAGSFGAFAFDFGTTDRYFLTVMVFVMVFVTILVRTNWEVRGFTIRAHVFTLKPK